MLLGGEAAARAMPRTLNKSETELKGPRASEVPVTEHMVTENNSV